MAKLTITGSTQPVVGNTEAYSLSVFDNLISSNSFSFPPPKIQWNIHVQDKKGWRITHGNTKEGEHITYQFTHKSLQYKALKIEVKRGKDKGELYIKPKQAEEPKILRVDVLDINSQRLQKGKQLHYTDTLIAKAHCVGMFGHKVSFTLWEDDAIGKGHDPVINMMNRINPVPLVGEVDHEGVAKVVFRLPSYTMAVQIANAQVARGDKSEGNTHEYYVTAEMISKHILKASPNVNVANPAHIPEPSEKQKPKENHPAHRKPPMAPEKREVKPDKPKPKEETAKYPQTPAAKKQAGPEGKIISAEFTDTTGKPLKNAKTGDTVCIKVIAQSMKGENVMIRIWEEDFSQYSNDLIYEVSVRLIHNTTNFINGVILTKDMYTKSYEWGEGNEKEYFIEVEHLNTSVTSQVIPVSAGAEPVKVDPNDSPAIIKEPKQDKKKDKLIIFPLLVKPENDDMKKWGKARNWATQPGNNMATYNAGRSGTTRKHAGRDLYTNPLETVVAIADGEVLEVRDFYCETHQVSIRHTLKDGRDFIIRYGELDPKSIKVKKGDKVVQKQELGKTGKLLKYIKKTHEYVPLMKLNGETIYMLHFEYFTGSIGFNLDKNPLTDKGERNHQRRRDVFDALPILREGYRNSFDSSSTQEYNDEHGFSEHDARVALLYIYDKHGREIAIIVEKMYRLETTHFTSEQYKNCGTGGMEVHGSAPYYGWDPTTFKNHPEYTPIGIWSHMEGKGLSGQGGNVQETKKPKAFVKLPSVVAGMEYKAEYIQRYNGNYARWYNAKDIKAQEKYRESLKGIKSKIVDSFKDEK